MPRAATPPWRRAEPVDRAVAAPRLPGEDGQMRTVAPGQETRTGALAGRAPSGRALAGTAGLVAAGVLLAAACGSPDTGGGAASPSTPAGSSTSSSPTPGATSSTPFNPESPTLPSSGRGRLMTVTGTVSAGVEAGCLLLTPDGASTQQALLLIGAVAGIKPGQRVTVRGAPLDHAVTTCQQGQPFQVSERLA
jgi:hypothetical protein